MLLAAARRQDGEYKNGVPRNLYWSAAILLAWDAGFRRGDVWLFRKSAVRPDGTVRLIQHKTGQIVTVKLRDSTLRALNAIHYDNALAWQLNPSFFSRHFRRLRNAAGVSRGSFKWLRRSSGSYVETLQAGAGRKHLGHSDAAVFDKFYDAKLGGHTLPQPPELDESA